MTISLPPSYVPLPVDVIEQAYKPDKPHRVLFASFVRLLALAWQNKYERTPRLREEDLHNTIGPDGSTQFGYLKLSRREYFTHVREMELLGWLRSTRPAAGFVQFIFSRSVNVSQAEPGPSAENRTEVQKTALDDLKRNEEEEDFKIKDSESSSSSSATPVRKIALTATEKQMQLLVEHLRLVFEPEDYGLLEWRDLFLAGIPERVLGWIAKAYQDRTRLASPIGLLVKHITLQDAPDRYFMIGYSKILPEAYLEAVGMLKYECQFCGQTFGLRTDLDSHVAQNHHICLECGQAFDTHELEQAHFRVEHDPERRPKPAVNNIPAPVVDGTIDSAWQSVLHQLQLEMPRASFETWVQDTQPTRYDGNGCIQIATRNAYARDWLENRVQKTAEQLLAGVLGRSVSVAFVVVENAHESKI
jgi:hypothetical protein